MSSRKRKCCVLECYDQTSPRHRFPIHNESLFDVWLNKIGNAKLMNMERAEVYSAYLICEEHFSSKYIVPGRGGTILTRNAVPTLHFKGVIAHPASNIDAQSPTNLIDIDNTAVKVAVPSTSKSSTEIATIHAAVPGVYQASDKSSTDIDFRSITPTTSKSTQDNVLGNDSCLLRSVQETRREALSPKATYFYKVATKLKRKAMVLNNRCASYKTRLGQATAYAQSHQFENILQKVNVTTYKFILSQIRTQSKKPKGRRFTFDDKVLALSLYKQSPKGYRLLAKIFSLPSKKTLNNLLEKVYVQPGINPHIFSNLKTAIQKLNTQEKKCLLIFDEMSLAPGLTYIRKHDLIMGLVDFGESKREAILANHVIVFMLKGIVRQWKQPIGFMFCKGTTSTATLLNTLTTVITSVQETGLCIVGTVCDQGTTNVGTINQLLALTHSENRCTFKINQQTIIPFYDPPHLMKGIRNNLLTKDLHFQMNGERKVAKWDHIVQFYKIDEGDDDTRMCPKLTDAHVMPDKIKKMKVSCCTQVFSRSVSALMRKVCEWNTGSIPVIDPRSCETADLLLFMDKLFDSVNGHTIHAPTGKTLKCAITSSSQHVNFWYECIKILETMRFMCPRRGLITVPTLKHWIHTLKCFIYVTENYVGHNGFKYIYPRCFNQDALENYFGCIRSHGVRNVNPTCYSFVCSYKTLMVNNFMSHHSLNRNCEEDNTEGALHSMAAFIIDAEEYQAPTTYDNAALGIPMVQRSRVSKCTRVYIAGFVARKLYSKTKDCEKCKVLLLHGQNVPDSDFIDCREYSAQLLCRPNSFLIFLVTRSISIISSSLYQVCHHNNVSDILISILKTNIDFNPLRCHMHPQIISVFCEIICKMMTFMWCKLVNRIISGNDTRYIEFARKNKPIGDTIKRQAFDIYIKSKRK